LKGLRDDTVTTSKEHTPTEYMIFWDMLLILGQHSPRIP
jgi:hypothetical protein